MTRTYPSEWSKFCKTIKTNNGFSYYASNIKAKILLGDINRFAARYSVAEDFNGVDIINSTRETRLGYEALMRALLTWSTLETYFHIFPVGLTDIYTCFSFGAKEKHDIRSKLNAIGNDTIKFYTFISSNCNTRHEANTNAFIKNNDFNPIMLLSAIRHVFGHGDLSANVNNVNPESINKIVNILKKEIMTKIDTSFSLLVQSHPDYSTV
ncbi:hypothetical protein [Yersinia enterocolitica]|uniref:hypothetical protein n=1 Tax=Yersinia enterocolitica TaxID=630 RepID=UPI000977E0C9|nr:hypothetical protein [Yersinia enterocolitica]